VDDHARRVAQPLADAWGEFQDGRASLLDLSRRAEQAAVTLDNSAAPLKELLARAAGDLEYAHFTSLQEEHEAEGHRILRPVLDLLHSA
jgi:hypothetical protein